MVQQLTWQSLSHQLKVLNEGSSLLSKIFSNGIQREITMEDLTSLPEYSDGTADKLISYGVLVEDNGFVAIESPHIDYFLDCQAANRRISVGVVKDCVDQLGIAIANYKTEKNEKKKRSYLRSVQKILKQTAQQSFNQVTVLKYEIREVYKQESNLEKKVLLLEKHREQGETIYSLIEESERMIAQEAMFFDVSCDETTKRIKNEVSHTLIGCHQWLSDISNEALKYLTQYQSRIVSNKKIRKLKELLDLQVLEGETDMFDRLKTDIPIWLDKQPVQKYRIAVADIDRLSPPRITEILKSRGMSSTRRKSSKPFTRDELQTKKKEYKSIDFDTVWYRFTGASGDLMTYITSRKVIRDGSWEDYLDLFCKIVEMHIESCRFEGLHTMNGYVYPGVYVK